MKEVVAGIDIGGTNVKMGLVDFSGHICWKTKIQTKQYLNPEEFARDACYFINRGLSELGDKYALKGIGIGAPNGNFYKGTIEFAPNLSWNGIIPLAEIFHKLSGVPCLLTNDANAAALGEMIFGGAKGVNDFIFITLGTGLGSGIVANGQLIYGHDGFAGELGHITVASEGRICGCARKGCLETYCSAPGLVKTYIEIVQESTSEKVGVLHDLTAEKIFELAKLGNEDALKAFSITAEILGKALATAVHFTSPQKIYLFGGLAYAGDFLFPDVQTHMENNLMSIFKNKVKVVPSSLSENEAAILGSASLIWNEK